MRPGHSISRQFATIFIIVMAFAMGLIFLANNLLLKRFYFSNKQKEIISAYDSLNKAEAENEFDTDEYDAQIMRICEKYSLDLLVMDSNSQMVKSTGNDAKTLAMRLWDRIVAGNAGRDGDSDLRPHPGTDNPYDLILSEESYSLGLTKDEITGGEYMEMWGTLDSGNLFLIRTAVESYWNVGVNLAVPVEDILDLGAAVKRKKLEVDQAIYNKDMQYDQLKLQIANLYTKITTGLIVLKTASENAAIYQGAGALNLEDFHNGNMSIEDFAETKAREDGAVNSYQSKQAEIITDILTLEIITHTPILTNSTTEITLDKAVQKSEKQLAKENKAVEKRIKKAAEEEEKKLKALEKAEAKAQKAAKKAAKK